LAEDLTDHSDVSEYGDDLENVSVSLVKKPKK
jgi:hypothetical protein